MKNEHSFGIHFLLKMSEARNGKVPLLARSQIGTLRKSDPGDARKLGLGQRSGVLKEIHIPDEQQEPDHILFRQRKKVWSDLNRCKKQDKRSTRI